MCWIQVLEHLKAIATNKKHLILFDVFIYFVDNQVSLEIRHSNLTLPNLELYLDKAEHRPENAA